MFCYFAIYIAEFGYNCLKLFSWDRVYLKYYFRLSIYIYKLPLNQMIRQFEFQ